MQLYSRNYGLSSDERVLVLAYCASTRRYDDKGVKCRHVPSLFTEDHATALVPRSNFTERPQHRPRDCYPRDENIKTQVLASRKVVSETFYSGYGEKYILGDRGPANNIRDAHGPLRRL